MKKTNLGNWFDPGSSIPIPEKQTWNDPYWISNCTESPWEHEAIFCTCKGCFILYHWSQWQGHPETCTEINIEAVMGWIIANQFVNIDEIISTIPFHTIRNEMKSHLKIKTL